MSKKINLLFVLPTLAAGGAERVLSFLAQNINAKDFDSTLLIIGKEKDCAFHIENTHTKFLNKKRVLNSIPSLFLFIVRNKPNIVLSSIGHLNTVFGLMAPFFPNCKFIIREASVISVMSKFSTSNRLYGILSKIAYKNIDAVICQSFDMAIDFKEIYGIPDDKIKVINNPITEIFPLKSKKISNKIIKCITVGRLSKEKGHERILEVLSQLPINFHYTIVGSGPEEPHISQKIDELKLKNKITKIPFTNEIGKILGENDVFLQGSYVEGFPNAVLESCVVGTPVIAFNAPGGTREIIMNGINGFLVSNENEFFTKIISFKDYDWDPIIIRNSVIKKFSKNNILKQYEDLLLKA